MRTLLRRTFAAILLAVVTVSLATAQTAPPADLDAYVARAMKEFDVPGIAIAIVKDGKVVVSKGYGVRKMGDPAPVDADTLFGIASNSKAFTAAAIGMLVDEGKVKWDDPLINYLPGLHMYDPYVAQQLTVRDALSHRSGLGLGAGDLLFWPNTTFTREDVVSHVRYIQPASSFRSKYAYNNLMFVVAGQIIPSVTGKPWEDFIRQRIFQPLGMTDSTITTLGFKPGDNVAWPHSRGWRLEGPLTPIAMTRDDVWAAAAGIKSSANDLAKWMIVQLNHGKINDQQRLFSEAAQRQMWAATTIIPISDPPAPLKALKPNFSAYGLGWSLRDYHGHRLVSHGGALTGMVSTVQLVPDMNLGVVILTNQEESGAFSAIYYHILDHYLGLEDPTDWIGAYRAARDESTKKANAAEAKQAAARATNSRPSLALASYAGDYKDPWYGDIKITLEGNKLVLYMMHTPTMVADLDQWQYDTFKAVFRDKTVPDAFVTFAITPEGKIDNLRMEAVSDLADFSFDYQDLHPKRVEEKTAVGK
jgi:CubicO group peptidase (beta-lactamase class C family)